MLNLIPGKYHCDSITVVDYHCNTIFSNIYACLKEEIKIIVGLFCMYGYQLCVEPMENIRIMSKSTNLAVMRRMQKLIHPTAN